MAAQTGYDFQRKHGKAGGIVDLAPNQIDAFINAEETGVLKCGYGVVAGTSENTIILPTEDSTTADFLGITVNGFTNEHLAYDNNGTVLLQKQVSIGVMRWGRIYGAIVEDLTITPNEPVYLVVEGDDVGKFTNVAEDGIAVGAKFASGALLGNIAKIDIANAVTVVESGTEYTLPTATDTVLGGIKVGTTLKIEDGVLDVKGE